jgi:hypothetical protein
VIANGWDEDEEDEESFARPELPRELPSFEEELAAIPLETMQALREEFLAGLYDPKDEGKVSHAAIVAEAAQRTREFLLACHDEKRRRQKDSPCHIAEASLAEFARRTLTLMCNGPMPQDKAIALVIAQIEAEGHAAALGGTYEEGIEKFRLSQQEHANHLAQLARMPKWEWQRDERGKLRPGQQLDPALKALFPPPGFEGKRARTERLRRFSLFVMSVVRDELPNVVAAEEERTRLMQDEKRRGVPKEKRSKPLSEHEKWGLVSKEELGRIEAETGRRLEKMKREGIPPELLMSAILWVPLWYDEHKSHERKNASDKAHAAKKRSKPPPASFS